MRFAGKVAVVTGGSAGLGAAIALRLGQEGATVVVADIVGAVAAATALTDAGVTSLGVDTRRSGICGVCPVMPTPTISLVP